VQPTDGRLSVPAYRDRAPRPISDSERTALVALADALIAPSEGFPAPSEAPDYPQWLDRALAARRDVFDDVVDGAVEVHATGDENGALRELADADPARFGQLSTVLAGAYLMLPAVRLKLGYPGQGPSHPRFDEAAEEIMDGILDPVIERGPVFRNV
jgi:hypothetical protein